MEELSEKILAAVTSAGGEVAYPVIEPTLTYRERLNLWRVLQGMKKAGKIVMSVRKDADGVQTTYIARGAN